MVKVPFGMRAVCVVTGLGVLLSPMGVAQSASAQTANEAAYHELLQRIADKKLVIAQKQAFAEGMSAEGKSLRAQIKALPKTKKSIKPMIDKMVAAIERSVAADYPFKKGTRLARIASLKELVADDKASVGEKYRSALNAYRIEVNYGQSLEAYKGNHPVTPTMREGDDRYVRDENGEFEFSKKTGLRVEAFDGDYLRYGRAAYVYLDKKGGEPLRYDLAGQEWTIMKGAETDIRRAIRISYGEVAPGVVMAPVLPTN